MAPPAPDRTITLSGPLVPSLPTERRSFAPAYVALVLGAVAMGVSPVFVRWVSPEVGPFASAFWRVALALPLLYGWMRAEEAGGHRAHSAATWPTLIAGAAFAGDLFFWHLAILGTTVANATFFATTAPVFVVLATWLVWARRPRLATIAGLALCLLGGSALLGESLQVAPGRILGDLYGLATAVFFGLYFLAIERARAHASAARVTFVSSLVTAAILLLVALVFDAARFWPTTLPGSAALLGLAWLSHAGGQGLLAVALGRLPAVFSSLVIFLEALVAAAAGSLLLGEGVSFVQAAGGALILLGIWIARPRRPRAEVHS
jgi:drug/metabolite transporter (DMT)-like permease